MSTTEHTINDAIADILRTTRHCWRTTHYVRSENTGAIRGSAKRPDIIVAEVNVSPVVIEVEVMPAINVETEAKSRLGEILKANGRTIMSSVAVRVADGHRLLVGKALRDALEADKAIEYALFTGDNPIGATRWPATGWLRGSLADLSLLTQSAGVPPEVIEQAADRLVTGVGEAAGLLNEVATTHPAVLTTIAAALC